MALKLNHYITALENANKQYYFNEVEHLTLENKIDDDFRTLYKSSAVYTALESVYGLAKEMGSAGKYESRLINIITELSVEGTSNKPSQLLPSLEAYQSISLEGIGDVLSNMITAIINFFKRIFYAIYNFFAGLFGYEKKIYEEKSGFIEAAAVAADKEPVSPTINIQPANTAFYGSEVSSDKNDSAANAIQFNQYLHLINEKQITNRAFGIKDIIENAKKVNNYLALVDQLFILENKRIVEEMQVLKTKSDEIMNSDDFNQEAYNQFITASAEQKKKDTESFFKENELIKTYYQLDNNTGNYLLKKEILPVLMGSTIEFNTNTFNKKYEFTEHQAGTLNIRNITDKISFNLINIKEFKSAVDKAINPNNESKIDHGSASVKSLKESMDKITSTISKYSKYQKDAYGQAASQKVAALTSIIQDVRRLGAELADLNRFLGKVIKHDYNTAMYCLKFSQELISKAYQ